MLGFLPPWSKGRTHYSPECHFCCSPPVFLIKSSTKEDQWNCPSCQTRYRQLSINSNELEPLTPSRSSSMLDPNDAPLSRPTCTPLEQGKLQFEDSLLCRTCQHHQSIIIQLLSAYEPLSPRNNIATSGNGASDDKEEGLDQDEEWNKLTQYRHDLERRYPLCALCRARVQERLQAIEYKVRTQRLASICRGSKKNTTHPNDVPISYSKKYHWWWVWIDVIMVQTLFSMVLFDVSEWDQGDLGRGFQLVDDYLTSIPVSVWYGMIVSLFIGNLAMGDLWRMTVGLIVVLLRLATIKILHVAQPKVNSSLLILLGVASYSALYLQYRVKRNQSILRKKKKNIFSTMNLPSTSTTINNQSSISASSIDLSTKLASLDTNNTAMAAWERLGPESPLDTRFTDLNSSTIIKGGGRNKSEISTNGASTTISNTLSTGMASSGTTSPFSRPLLSTSHAQQQTSRSLTASPVGLFNRRAPPMDLRPSTFDGIRQNGLESVLEGFRIDEQYQQHKNQTFDNSTNLTSTIMTRSIKIFDQIVLTMGFLLARFVVSSQIPLIVLILLIGISMRNTLWPRLSPLFRCFINLMALGRLIWLAMKFDSGLIPIQQLMMIEAFFQNFHFNYPLEMIIDGIILLTR